MPQPAQKYPLLNLHFCWFWWSRTTPLLSLLMPALFFIRLFEILIERFSFRGRVGCKTALHFEKDIYYLFIYYNIQFNPQCWQIYQYHICAINSLITILDSPYLLNLLSFTSFKNIPRKSSLTFSWSMIIHFSFFKLVCLLAYISFQLLFTTLAFKYMSSWRYS